MRFVAWYRAHPIVGAPGPSERRVRERRVREGHPGGMAHTPAETRP
jgi:hypothetical protein